jgi:hypothetical protein
MTTAVNAAQNPDLVNSMVAEALKATEKKPEPVTIMPPSDTVVTLPGGYVNSDGEVITSVEVRELTGKDEEAIARATSMGKALLTILSRGVVKVGDDKATDAMLDSMLSGDRDAILVGIYKATFGSTSEMQGVCPGCNEFKDVTINVDEDVQVRPLANPEDRVFTVDCKVGEVKVMLPTGHVQKDLIHNADKSVSELTTILLSNCVREINGNPVLGKAQIQNLGINDRKLIAEAITENNIGPIFKDIKVTCPDCESEVTVPFNLGNLFRF